MPIITDTWCRCRQVSEGNGGRWIDRAPFPRSPSADPDGPVQGPDGGYESGDGGRERGKEVA
jgi:hypothetical protein